MFRVRPSPYRFQDIKKKVVKVTPIEKPLNKVLGGKKSFKHTALKVTLEDGTKRVIEYGPNYGQRTKIKTSSDCVAPPYNKEEWIKTAYFYAQNAELKEKPTITENKSLNVGIAESA
jgi:hypothetical protein